MSRLVQMHRGAAAVGVLLLTASLSLLMPGSSGATSGSPESCPVPASGDLQAVETPQSLSVEACELAGRSLEFEDLAVPVPPMAHTMTGEIFGPNGVTQITIEVSDEGIMTHSIQNSTAGIDEPTAADESDLAASTKGCGLTAYSFAGNHVANTWQFYRGDGATPAGSTKAEFGDAMYRAAMNITGAQSPCDDKDGVDVSFNFAGETSTESDIVADGAEIDCLPSGADGQDSVNTVDFKSMPTGIVGGACVLTGNSGNVTEADVRLNSSLAWTFKPGDSDCSTYKQYDVESVLTHEFGHVYGLDHVSNYYATMYTNAQTCKKYPRSLAGGDLAGLRALY